MRLYDLITQHIDLMDKINGLETPDGEIDAELEKAIADLQTDEAAKLESLRQLIETLEMEREKARDEVARYQAIADIRRNGIARIKERIQQYLEATERKSATTSTGRKFTICNNGGRLSIEFADDFIVERLPAQYWTIKPIIKNLDELRKALESGEQLPGVSLGERGTHLRVS